MLLTLSSLPPFRRFSYPLFFTLHYVSILGFLVFLNKHTIYARGWATYSIAIIYAIDIVGRVMGMRIRWVEVESLDEGMTRVGMRGLKGGWRGGMTVDVRLFFLPPLVTGRSETEKGSVKSWTRSVYRAVKFAVRPFESHPFSIATAPPSRSTSTLPPQTSSISNQDQGIELYIKSCGLGTWSNDLYLFAKSSSSSSTASLASDKSRPTTKHVLALISGPYPGSGLPTFETKEVLEEKENLILIAGGSGMSFVIGVLDEVVGRRVRAGRGGDVKVIWVVKEQGKSRFSLEFRRFRSLTSSMPPYRLQLKSHGSSLVSTRSSRPFPLLLPSQSRSKSM